MKNAVGDAVINAHLNVFANSQFFVMNALIKIMRQALLHDCLYFSNNSLVFDKKRIKSKISFEIKDNIEAKFYVMNINRCSKFLIWVTDNGNFEEDSEEDVKNIYGVDLICREKMIIKMKGRNL